MKITDVFEDDLAARREQKQQEKVGIAHKEMQEVLQDIDDTVSAGIDKLISVGMTEDNAEGVVYKRLSDLVMAADLK
jgi:hypothetical protein